MDALLLGMVTVLVVVKVCTDGLLINAIDADDDVVDCTGALLLTVVAVAADVLTGIAVTSLDPGGIWKINPFP